MREGWVLAAIGLTVVLGFIALSLTPDWSASLGTTLLIAVWIGCAIAIVLAMIIVAIFSMMFRGVEGPIRVSLTFLSRNRKRIGSVAALTFLAGLNMIAFLLAKPLLNYYVPFGADPLLADIDSALFFGDPARFLTWLNTTPLALFYHRGWFALLIAALLLTLWQPALPTEVGFDADLFPPVVDRRSFSSHSAAGGRPHLLLSPRLWRSVRWHVQ